MRVHFITRLLALIFAMALILCAAAIPVHANSAQSWFEGTDSTGAIMPDGESPIIVEHELLTFDIGEFPSNYYESAEALAEYSASVTAEYTFYNPSQYTVNAKLLFPFGCRPHYYMYDGYEDTEKFDITVNGEPIEKNIRHTLSNGYSQFELEKDLKLMHDGFVSDGFFTPDMTVTVYYFQLQDIDTENYNRPRVALDIPKGLGDRRFYLYGQNGMHIQKDGDMRIIMSVTNYDNVFSFYVFGTPLSEMPEWQIYKDGGADDGEEADGRIDFLQNKTETMTFREYVLMNRLDDSEISETDWYNATVAKLNNSMTHPDGYPVISGYRLNMHDEGELMRWYEYEITLAPGERITNTVKAPMYPAIDLDYEPNIYEYTYLLSPAKTWKSFGELEIVINTPFELTESAIKGFNKTDNGYSATLDGLPDGELTFTLSTSLSPKKPSHFSSPSDEPYWSGIIAVGALFVGIGLAIAGGVAAIILVNRKKHKNKK